MSLQKSKLETNAREMKQKCEDEQKQVNTHIFGFLIQPGNHQVSISFQ